MKDVVLKIKNLSKSFDGRKILDAVSLDVYDGENFVVFGRSGTGKSVLLKSVVRLLEPDDGEIFINGENVLTADKKKLTEIRRNIGFLFQSSALYDSMSVRENLSFPLRKIFGITDEKILEQKVRNTLRHVGLESAIDKMPSELSGGMQKRVGLARSIITEPKLMLYDEPTTGLDPITSKEISKLILDLQKKLKMTSVVVTHDLICAEIISDRVIFLKDAKIYAEGTLEELKTKDDDFLRNFFSNKILSEQGE
jgi:phospholipid/cholesterol/gamma-HCH transport system ATP-binding protein